MANLDREKSSHLTVLLLPVQECKKPHAFIVIQVFKTSFLKYIIYIYIYIYIYKAVLVYSPVCTPRMI